MRVASTAVSMVAWPLIRMTGMVSRPPVAPSLGGVEPCDSVGVGHPNIEQHQVVTGADPRRARLGGVFRQVHTVAFVVQDFGEQVTDAQLVVHHQYVCHV